MLGKVLVIVFAIAAGAGGAAAYEYASIRFATLQEEEKDGHLLALESRLAAVDQKLCELNAAQDAVDPRDEILASRLEALEGRLAEIQKKKAGQATSDSKQPANPEGKSSAGPDSGTSADGRVNRISGEELVAALKELPEEGVQMIKDAIRKEVLRVKDGQEGEKNPKAQLERKAEQGIRKLTTALSLTPVQVEQVKEIASRFIDKVLEVNRIAGERDDPSYAANAKKELEVELRAEVVQILTPEQLDRARELDPEGVGKQYPRGF